MTDDAELQARIAAIKGRIDRHRTHPTPPNVTQKHYSSYAAPPHGAGRWAPYHANRGQPYKNRSLVVAAEPPQQGTVRAAPGTDPNPQTAASPGENIVKTRGTNNQLMTKSTYEREQTAKKELKSRAPAASKQRLQNYREQQRLAHHFQSPTASRELEMDGIRFSMKEDGSKLVRIIGEALPFDGDCETTEHWALDPDNMRETPKKAVIAGVDFLRTKNGNLLRKGAIKETPRYRGLGRLLDDRDSPRGLHRITEQQRPQCENFTKNGTLTFLRRPRSPTKLRILGLAPTQIMPVSAPDQPLIYHTGTCPYGPACRFTHDPEKVAMCKTFLRSGVCPSGKYCDLSHDPTYHRVPACTHFFHGTCKNDACRYPHIRISPGAPVCRPFATLGYCADGPKCEKRHVSECPDYANTGQCPNFGKCPLPHVLRASNGRKSDQDPNDDDSEIEAEEDHDHDHGTHDDVDSDDLVEDLITAGLDDGVTGLKRNDDFVALG